MCWNREVSIISGTTASILCVYLIINGKKNDIIIAVISLTIALMQFAEAFMWEGYNTGNISKSNFGGNLGLVALFLQPLALGLSILLLSGYSVVLSIAFVVLWVVLGVPNLLPLLKKKWLSKPGCNGHLQWEFLEPMLSSSFAPLYWIVMLFGWLLMKPISEGIHYSILALTTLFITWNIFPGEWGSLWCFIANLLPLGRILW